MAGRSVAAHAHSFCVLAGLSCCPVCPRCPCVPPAACCFCCSPPLLLPKASPSSPHAPNSLRRPELLRWTVERMGESGAGLGVRLTLGGVLFGGILAPLGGTASGGVTPRHRPLSALLGDAATAAAAGGAAEVAARGLQPAVSGISLEQPAGSRRAGQGGTPAATGALSLAATGGRGGGAAVPASQW